MTRAEIEATYKVVNGRIVSPGKFEGEPVYVPAYWEAAVNGWGEDLGHAHSLFDLSEDDYRDFPELRGAEYLLLVETDQGFVIHTLLTDAQADNLRNAMSAESEGE